MVTISEPEWDAEDRAIIQAAVDIRADQCSGCGEPLSESLHVDGKPDPVYAASYAVCVSCKTRQTAMDLIEKRDESTRNAGGSVFSTARHWVLTRIR